MDSVLIQFMVTDGKPATVPVYFVSHEEAQYFAVQQNLEDGQAWGIYELVDVAFSLPQIRKSYDYYMAQKGENNAV